MKRSIRKRPLFLYILAFVTMFYCLQVAGGSSLPIKTYTSSDGLAHDRIFRIVRDSRGFLWFCTGEGLSRFDGSEFKNYTPDDGLPHRAITDLLETKSGEIWLATGDGLVLFDPSGWSKRETGADKSRPMFRVFRPEDLSPDFKTWGVRDLIEDRNGVIWLAGAGGVYNVVRLPEPQLVRVDLGDGPNIKSSFQRLLEDNTGAIWVGMESGLYRILPDGRGIQAIEKTMRVESMSQDRSGRIWVGTGGGKPSDIGLRVFWIKDDIPVQIHDYRKKDGLSDDWWINKFLETSDGRTFVVIANGLCEYVPNDDPSQPQFRVISSQGMTDGLTDIEEDQSGNLWLATTSSGTQRIARQGFISYDKEDGLPTKNITSIISAFNGETFILGRGQKHIFRFDGDGFDVASPRGMFEPSWGEGQISFRDHLGSWWIGGIGGLQRFPKVRSFEELNRVSPERTFTIKEGLCTNEVFQLFEDSRGDIWITCMGAALDNVARWDRSTDTIRHFTSADGIPSRNTPVSFAEDKAGNIWFGLYAGGVNRFRNGRFEVLPGVDDPPTGWINNVFADSSGRIWIATSYRGVIRIDDPTLVEPHFESLTTGQGLSSNQANCITEDKFHRIYIGTARGVDRLDLQTGNIRSFSKSDGLPENFISQCKRDANGDLWFGASHGLARYEPFADEKREPPPISISELRVNGEKRKKLSELGETAVNGIELSSDERQIQIGYFGLGFGAGEKIRFQYMFDGIDNVWSQPTDQRTVNLNLAPGNYRFLVRAVNADGVVSLKPASLSFVIARPIWQRWWFLLFLTVLLLLIIYAVYRYRLRRLVELERVRTRIATDLHDDIGSSLSKIAILSEVVRQRAGIDAVNEPLNVIADTSREMVDSMSDIVWAINPNKDHFSDLVLRMRRFASDVLDASDIVYRFRVDDVHRETTLGTDLRREVYLIFKECVNNLVKHASATEAEISVSVENRVLLVTISDNGKGFDLQTQTEPSDGFGGNGLINMRRRAEKLGGYLSIESKPGVGTTTNISIPVKDNYSPRPTT